MDSGKLLDRMRRTPFGWSQDDLRRLYEAYGSKSARAPAIWWFGAMNSAIWSPPWPGMMNRRRPTPGRPYG